MARPKPLLRLKPAIEADEVFPGLFQGSAPPEGGALRHLGVDVLVLAAQEHQPPRSRFPGVGVLHAPLDDHQEPLTREEILLIREMGKRAGWHVLQGRVVLVTCMAGLNRSGIISATALCFLGLTPEQAVDQIRRQRSDALFNRSFVRQLPRIVSRR